MSIIDAKTVGTLPALAAEQFGKTEALIFEGKRWNFEEFSDKVDDIAKSLLAIGIKPGEKVSLWMMNRPEWLFINYAVAKIGAILVPLNTRYRTKDVAYAINQSDSVAWIFQAQSGPINYYDMVRENLNEKFETNETTYLYKNFPKLREVVVFGGNPDSGIIGWNDFIQSGEEIADDTLDASTNSDNSNAIFLIAYTSGTTGAPKGVMHCHHLIKNTLDRISRLKITSDDIIINSLPLFHLYAYGEGAICSMLTGAKQILTETFDASENLDLIEKEKVTIVHGFDTHYKDMLESKKKKYRDTSTLRLGTFPSGAPSSVSIALSTQKELVKTVSGWGMTETWAFATVSSLDDTLEQRCEASGYPIPGIEIKIINPETGKEQDIGEQGELIVRSYMNMQGYYNNEEETKKILKPDGWLHTGDTAILREDGHIRFLGRFKDMLKVGGENVSPLEIEAFLLKLTKINQVAVVGYPDERLYEVPAAFVVLQKKEHITLEEIQLYCRDRIASFKIPRYLFCTDKLPMTPTGKVQKHVLRKKAIDNLS